MTKSWLALSALCSMTVAPRVAGACGASAPTEYQLVAVLPAAGQAIPTDGAIIVRRKNLAPVGAGNLDAAQVLVKVRDASNAEIPGTTDSWDDFDDGWSLAWTPKAPLSPNATVSVEATVGAPSSAPAATDGLKVSATLQTAAGPAPAVQLSGDLTIALEAYDRPTFLACPASCGGTCPPGAPVRSLRARVTIPPLTGGFAPTGFVAWLWITNDVPHGLPDEPAPGLFTVSLGGIERLGDGTKPTVAFRDLPAETTDYAPCFALRAFDPAGHYDDRTLCLPKLNVTEKLAQLDSSASGAAGPGGAHDGGGSGGCSVSGSSDEARAGLILLLAVLSVARLRASRRLG